MTDKVLLALQLYCPVYYFKTTQSLHILIQYVIEVQYITAVRTCVSLECMLLCQPVLTPYAINTAICSVTIGF